ncbi:MAG TPA: mannose-1-phosphate guanylyltransferase [Bacillota bacterium]|nr:mannose-1-phosphate guanylyltransferase [Bacillota bacterium]
MLVALIMAGGKGERFWPKSRERLPKQFLNLTGKGTLLQLTIDRILSIIDWDRIFLVCGSEYVGLVREQLPLLPAEHIIVEPEGRNTAPCIALGALHIQKTFPDAVMAVLPADHFVQDHATYCSCLLAAAAAAEAGQHLVTLGIRPTRPETGYGYIRLGEYFGSPDGRECYRVKRFVEKPDLDSAWSYLANGDFLWNSGIFVWRTDVILSNFATYMPELYQGLERISKAWDTPYARQVLEEEYHRMDKTSIDYGIMENAESILVFPCEFAWDDVGSWTALERIGETDQDGNVLKGNIIAVDTKDCVIEGPLGDLNHDPRRVIAALGVRDLIVVDTGDVLLICPKTQAQNVRRIIEQFRVLGETTYL